MGSTKQLLAAAVVAATTLTAFAANALPVYLGYSLDGGATKVTLATGNGGASVNSVIIGSFSITFGATGSPTFNEPNFGSNTLTVSGTGPGSILLYASEIGITNRVASITSGLSNNPLSTVSVLESTYAQKCAAAVCTAADAYATTGLLASGNVAPGITMTSTSPFPASITAGSQYSNTESYLISFTAGGGTVNATILEIGNVPEPMSLAILGSGLFGLGLLRHRRKS